MLVTIASHPRTDATRLPRSGLRLLAEGLRIAGAAVHEDARAFPGADPAHSAAGYAEHLAVEWTQARPDVVHTFGLVATTAALAAGEVPVVATFDERPAHAEAEHQLASRVAAVLPLSTPERDRWRRLGVPTLNAGVFPTPLRVPDPDAGAAVGGHVVVVTDGPEVDAVLEALPGWECAGLVITARLTPHRWHELRSRARALGILDRVAHRPGLRGRHRESMWSATALVVAGDAAARHGGFVLEAAARGIPAVATARDAHLDHVVPGTTGLLIDPADTERMVVRAVGGLLADRFALRALGRAAMVRAASVHDPQLSGQRLLGLYHQVLGSADTVAHDTGAPRPGDAPSAAPAAGMDRPARDALAMAHLPLARQLAGWYADRGQSREDLQQVAYLGLLLAAERFDPTRGAEFHSFAVPTILGELRRHFRDHAWGVRVPRGLQETVLQVRRAADDLAPGLGHEATAADLAERIEATEADVRHAMLAGSVARTVESLDQPIGEQGTAVADLLGGADPGHALAEVRGDVLALLRRLPEREQQVLLLRFHGERTQSEIAERLGISQVHVSRILTRTLEALRAHLLDDAPLPAAWQDTPARRTPARRTPARHPARPASARQAARAS